MQLPSAGTGMLWIWYTNGPYSASEGKPEKLTVKSTPVPFAFVAPVIEPVIKAWVALSKFEAEGRSAR